MGPPAAVRWKEREIRVKQIRMQEISVTLISICEIKACLNEEMMSTGKKTNLKTLKHSSELNRTEPQSQQHTSAAHSFVPRSEISL